VAKPFSFPISFVARADPSDFSVTGPEIDKILPGRVHANFQKSVMFGKWKSPKHNITRSRTVCRASVEMSACRIIQVLNAILYVSEHGGKWRGLPERFGRWHTIYMRMSRWSRAGVLERVFERLQRAQILRLKIEAVSLDSSSVKARPDGSGALKKNGAQSIGKSRGGWNTQILLSPA
jgi:transposase